jgi:hypothetical protein
LGHFIWEENLGNLYTSKGELPRTSFPSVVVLILSRLGCFAGLSIHNPSIHLVKRKHSSHFTGQKSHERSGVIMPELEYYYSELPGS